MGKSTPGPAAEGDGLQQNSHRAQKQWLCVKTIIEPLTAGNNEAQDIEIAGGTQETQ